MRIIKSMAFPKTILKELTRDGSISYTRSYKDEIHHDLEQALEKEDEYNAILPIQIHEETRYIGAKAVIIRDKNKNAIKMFGINWDRTKEHKLSLELEEQKKVSYHNSKLISLGELAAGIGPN